MKELKLINLGILIFLILIVFGIIVSAIIIVNKDDQVPSDYALVDYVLVLGAQVLGNGSLSPHLQGRLDLTLKNFKNHNSKIIVSGGQGKDEPQTEASAMKAYLINGGIAANRIITEQEATSTYQNLSFSKALITDFSEQNIVIISSSYHLARVKMLANRGGYQDVYFLGVPNSATIKNASREGLAYIKSFIFDI